MLDMSRKGRQLVRELSSDSGEEIRSTAAIPLAPLEEEAGAKRSSAGQFVSHSARNCRLSSACHALQPVYAFTIRIVGPFVNSGEEIGSSAGQAYSVVFVGMRVVRGAFDGAQLSKEGILVDVDY